MLHFNVCHFYTYFHYSCVGETDTCIELATVLAFTTGAEAIPPMGFNEPLSLHFNTYDRFPTASTCAFELTLPIQYYNICNEFKKKDLWDEKPWWFRDVRKFYYKFKLNFQFHGV